MVFSDDLRLVLVELVPGDHPVVVDLVNEPESLCFGGARDVERTLEVQHAGGTVG